MTVERPEGTAARQALLLDSAIDVIGAGGLRALTHRALDRAAELPEGSCSVYYRTRASLLAAVTERVAQRLTDDVLAMGCDLPRDPEETTEAIEATVAMLANWAVHPALLVTMAELGLESVRTPELREAMVSWRRQLVEIVRELVEQHGRDHAELRARTVVAGIEGVAIQSLSEPAETRAAFLAATTGLLINAISEAEIG
ncbi:TetR/AcrR family transcriptional regulator [Calidifontibacter terrae]